MTHTFDLIPLIFPWSDLLKLPNRDLSRELTQGSDQQMLLYYIWEKVDTIRADSF